MYPIERNMWIGVAASEEDSSAGELTCVVARRAFRADKAAAQPNDAAIAARVPCRVFEAQAGPLRKSDSTTRSGSRPSELTPSNKRSSMSNADDRNGSLRTIGARKEYGYQLRPAA